MDFQGPASVSLDEKGRFAMPTRFRDGFSASNNQITLTRHPHGGLLIFPRARWLTVRQQMDSVPMDQQWVKRIFIGFATDVDMDKSGRVLIAPELRTALQMTPNASLMVQGLGSYLEAWDEATYWRREQEARATELFHLRQSAVVF